MNKYYFTFGSEGHPYVGGWITIEADNMELATQIFRILYPDKNNGFLRYAFRYTEDEFKRTIMYEKGSNLGAACHCEIKLEIKKTAEPALNSGQIK